MSEDNGSVRAAFAAAIGFLGMMAVVVAIAISKEMGLLDADAAKRAIGMAIGIALIVAANFVPKMRPLQRWGRDARAALAAERFAGWALVLAGVAFVGLWAFAPLDRAPLASSLVGGAALFLVTARWSAVLMLAREDITEAAPADDAKSFAKRLTMYEILHGLFWAFAMILGANLLRGQAWADNLVAWMLVGYVMSNSILLWRLRRKSHC